MRLASLMLVLAASGCECNERLQPASKCWLPCFTGDPTLAGHGACDFGTWVCNEAGDEESAVCIGQGQPTNEVCDGIDNDCDGKVDGLMVRRCSNGCGNGTEVCKNGEFVECDAPPPQAEVCNGIDDDCDGKTDEPEDVTPELTFCYDGGELRGGNCHPGFVKCVSGQLICYGQVLPQQEICDNQDNDCDGEVDEDGASAPTDIVFVMDNSGSMGAVIAAVKQGVSSFSNVYGGRSELRWGLVVAPSTDPALDGQVKLYMDFSSAADFTIGMRGMGASGGGMEPTLDALADLANPSNPLHLSWAIGSRHVVVLISDELPQSWRDPPNTNTPTGVGLSLLRNGVSAYVLTTQGSVFDWSFVVPQNRILDLPADGMAIQLELQNVIQEASCQ